jgi:hypothetical protein
MTTPEPHDRADAEATAQRSADRLAVALEDVGFDVGRAFPTLRGAVDRDGAPVVEFGRISHATASDLTGVLVQAARQGIAL